MRIEEAEIQRKMHREQLHNRFIWILNQQCTNGNLFKNFFVEIEQINMCIQM